MILRALRMASGARQGNRLTGSISYALNGFKPSFLAVHGAGVDEPLVWLEKNASNTFDKRYLYADNQGSIIGVTDASGNKIAINAYDEYGVPQGGNLGRFQYTGQAYMAEVGLYYYKARFYSPTLGKFMQPDPIGYSDGMNLYAYAGNDPVNMTDPSGLEAEDCGNNCSVTVTGKKHRLTSGHGQCEGGYIENGNGECVSYGEYYGLPSTSGSSSSSSGGGEAVAEIIVKKIKKLYCSLPTLGMNGSVRGYAGVGGGFATDTTFDPKSGRLSMSMGPDLGVGWGGSGDWSGGGNFTMGRNVPDGFSGSIGGNVNVRAGPVAVGAAATFLDKRGLGFKFNGISGGLRAGTGVTVNANLTARVGYGGKIAPSCKG